MESTRNPRIFWAIQQAVRNRKTRDLGCGKGLKSAGKSRAKSLDTWKGDREAHVGSRRGRKLGVGGNKRKRRWRWQVYIFLIGRGGGISGTLGTALSGLAAYLGIHPYRLSEARVPPIPATPSIINQGDALWTSTVAYGYLSYISRCH